MVLVEPTEGATGEPVIPKRLKEMEGSEWGGSTPESPQPVTETEDTAEVETSETAPLLVVPTSGEDKYIVREQIPGAALGEYKQSIKSKEEIESIGGRVPIGSEKSVRRQFGQPVPEAPEPMSTPPTEAQAFSEKHGGSPSAAELTITTYKANPQDSQFRSLSATEIMDLNKAAGLPVDTNLVEVMRSWGGGRYVTKAFMDVVDKTAPYFKDVIIKDGIDAYNRELQRIGRETLEKEAKDILEFEQSLSDMPQVLQDAYNQGGIPEYNKAVIAYNQDLQQNYIKLSDGYIPIKEWNEFFNALPPTEVETLQRIAFTSGWEPMFDKYKSEFNQNNIELADGKYMNRKDFDSLDLKYQSIGLLDGFTMMKAKIDSDNVMIEKTISDLKPFTDEAGGVNLPLAIKSGISPENLKKVFTEEPEMVDKAVEAVRTSEETAVSLAGEKNWYNIRTRETISDEEYQKIEGIQQDEYVRSAPEARRGAILGASMLAFAPVKAALPEVKLSDVKAIDWAVGGAQLATWSLPFTKGIVTPALSGVAGGIFGTATVQNWDKLDTTQKVIAVTGDVLVMLPLLGAINKNVVGAATAKVGDTTVWKGLQVLNKPAVGKSAGKVVIGGKKITVPEDIPAGYEPVTKIERNIMATQQMMERLGIGEEGIERVNVVWNEAIPGIPGRKSPGALSKAEIEATKTLSPEGVAVVIDELKNQGRNLRYIYGSYTAKPQLKEELRGLLRQAGDIDSQVLLSQEATESLAQKIANRLESVEGIGNVRVSPDTPTLIEKRGADGAWHNAVDLHSKDFTPGSDVSAEGAYGYVFDSPRVTMEYPGIGKVQLMSLSEMTLRKAASATQWRPTKLIPTGKIGRYADELLSIDAVANDIKPVADVIDTSYNRIAAKLKGLKVTKNPEIPEDILVFKNKVAADTVIQILSERSDVLRKGVSAEIPYHIKLGEAYGYSKADISAFLKNNYTKAQIRKYAPDYLTIKPISGIEISPEPHRTKDIADLYMYVLNFKGKNIADKIADAFGLNVDDLLKIATENPPEWGGWIYNNTTGKVSGTPIVKIELSPSIAASLSPSLRRAITSPVSPYAMVNPKDYASVKMIEERSVSPSASAKVSPSAGISAISSMASPSSKISAYPSPSPSSVVPSISPSPIISESPSPAMVSISPSPSPSPSPTPPSPYPSLSPSPSPSPIPSPSPSPSPNPSSYPSPSPSPKLTPTVTPPPTAMTVEKETDEELEPLLTGEIAWYQGTLKNQGEQWYVGSPPFKQASDFRRQFYKPVGATIVKGIEGAKETIQQLGYSPEFLVNMDFGAFDLKVSRPEIKGDPSAMIFTRDLVKSVLPFSVSDIRTVGKTRKSVKIRKKKESELVTL